MTRDARHSDASRSLDDEALGRLVAGVVEDWTMPPTRLDQPGWRDRVRSPGARRRERFTGGFGRLGRAATGAVALTVAAALVAVYLTSPQPIVGPPASSTPGPSPGGTSGATPDASDGIAATPLPKLVLHGDLPEPSEVLVEVGPWSGQFARVDLATGAVGRPLTNAGWPNRVWQAANGELVCLCVNLSDYRSGGYAKAAVELLRIGEDGAVLSRAPVTTVSGEPDPRDAGAGEQPSHVQVEISFSADGRLGFVGWAARAYPAWQSGLLVIDTLSLATRAITLPDLPAGDDGTRVVANAPRVVGVLNAPHEVAISQSWYTFEPGPAVDSSYRQAARAFTAAAEPTPRAAAVAGKVVEGLDGCGDSIPLAGPLPDGGLWVGCLAGSTGALVVRRIDDAGRPIGEDVRVPTYGDVEGTTSAVSRDGSWLYSWHPFSLVLTRVDLRTGERHDLQVQAPASAEGGGPLAALGRWLAPSAAAKVLLRSGLVVSADGTRAWALGIRGPAAEGSQGSAGVFAFDLAAFEASGAWAPTADFASLAASADGRFVYAAGMPGLDAAGRRSPNEASITVYDTSDGSVRLIAGQLGSNLPTFPSEVLD